MSSASFTRFCKQIDFDLEPFQKRIASAAFDPDRRELLVLLPRGSGKTKLLAALCVHHLLSTERPACYCAASSQQQASLLYDYAVEFASHPSLDGKLTVRWLEIRGPHGGHLKVLAADAPRLHGLTPSYIVLDEAHAAADDSVYVALRTATMKRRDCRMVTISTAGQGADSFLGKLRARALAQPEIIVRGALTEARGPTLRMLQWAVPDDADLDDPRVVKRANPASWITVEALRDQREALPDLAFKRFHANQWTAREGAWLPAGAWQACAGTPEFEPGEEIVVAVDLSGGGGRSDTAVTWVNDRFNVGVEIFTGDHDATAEVLDLVSELAETYRIKELVLDMWRASGLASEFEQRGLTVVSWPQTDVRVIPSSKALYDAIIGRRIVHPDNPDLNRHMSNVIARQSRRGLRIDRPSSGETIDGVVALLMALDRISNRPAPAVYYGSF